ncbi:hypothetical protein QFC19_000700 [Naganishia cerealis]|uniref:Uncharacterized protein n=1 Tax=Naganishia cerealis TaxID=610337 RepID=A0ACC2WLG5_9TREE|nr:hypothetical protein QFC19_000700 [Naganishia cerealis]
MRALLLSAALLLQLAPATAAPPPGLGPLRPHQSPGWDERHHQAHYSRWSRLDTEHVLHKRQRGDPERTAIQHLFKREADGVFPRSVHDLEFHLAIRLLPRDQDLVEHKLNALHDPSHSSFRQYLDREETMRLLAPSQEALDLAYRFLSEHGIQESHVERTDDNQTLSFWVDIERANRMLNADFAVHKLIDRSRSDPASTPQRNALYQLGTKEYSLPQALAKYVGHINPGNDFPACEAKHSRTRPDRHESHNAVKRLEFTSPARSASSFGIDNLRFRDDPGMLESDLSYADSR